MTTVAGQDGGHEHDAPMVWAVNETDLLPVFVRSLPRDRNGLACACVCPECGAKLQAINVGLPDEHFLRPGVRRPHFRHHSQRQGLTCRAATARLAALHLLVGSDELDLPPPSVTSDPLVGVSGQEYTCAAQGQRILATVVSREWIDRQKAILHLASGKTIAIILVNRTRITSVGGVDGVLVIEGDDPEVANMDPADLVRHVQLDGKWLRWARHWDDEQLRSQAAASARDIAAEALDEWPQELELPEGLSTMQRSESVLHWAVKEALAGMPFIKVPAMRGTVQQSDHRGIVRQGEWSLAPTTLRIRNPRLEFSLGDMVPDILCSAFDAAGPMSHDALLIEVAVTHKVDAVKLEKIKLAGLACLEIDATKLAVAGRIHRRDLPQILRDSACILWLHHPAILAVQAQARRELSQRLAAAQQEEERIQKRSRFLDSASEQSLYQALLTCLKVDWQEGPGTSVRYQEIEINTMAVVSALAKHRPGFEFDGSLMGADGVLRTLLRWQDTPGWAASSKNVVSFIHRLQSAHGGLGRYITLGLLAIKVGIVKIDARDEPTVQRIRSDVWKSLSAGHTEFARPDVFEAFIGLAIPRLRSLLDPVATVSATRERASEIQRKQWQEEREELLRQEQSRAAAATQAERLKELQDRRDLIRKLSVGEWQPVLGICQDVSQAKRLAMHVTCRAIDRDAVIERAWAARQEGKSVAEFYYSLQDLSQDGLKQVARVLYESYLKL